MDGRSRHNAEIERLRAHPEKYNLILGAILLYMYGLRRRYFFKIERKTFRHPEEGKNAASCTLSENSCRKGILSSNEMNSFRLIHHIIFVILNYIQNYGRYYVHVWLFTVKLF